MLMTKQDLPAIGAPLEGGFFGGVIRLNDTAHAVIWAPKASGETTGAWLPSRKAVTGASSCCDSMANTAALAEAGSPLAKWAQSLDIGGHLDWCLPARDVLELAYRHLKPTERETYCSFRDGDNPSSIPAGYPYGKETPVIQTTVEAFRDDGAEAFAPKWYWASTQYSAGSAWGQYFHYGDQIFYDTSFEGRARAVRLIQLAS